MPELVSRLQTLVGATFDTDVGVGKSKRNKTYNVLGTPVYPDPENRRPAPKNEA